ncbi:hypothetical protein AWZ03_006599 [Drosophila navojoa]|uniref:Ras-GEF domain-containing protein n=1 Tax=Drosophila navojoa TaxID=7232 RepID=A0A484BE65_DRONA|nr:hypothetical protein AWZ03_006599 [Drosophila navojoa]
MAMYFYANKISAIVCGARCKQAVLQKSRGSRDRDKDKCRRHRHRHRSRRRTSRCPESSSDSETSADDGCCGHDNVLDDATAQPDVGIFLLNASSANPEAAQLGLELGFNNEGMRLRRRHSAEQLNAHDLELGLQQFKLAAKDDPVQYDVPKNTHKRSQCDINFESSVLGSGGIMYINGKIVSGPLDSFPEVLNPKNVMDLDKKKWDQPISSGGPPGVQDPKKTCNLETYLDWSARLRLFVCNEILQCTGIEDRSRTVELWSGVAQYCLLVGNYNSATAILESLESPAIARLKITWSKLQVTCQQLDCMQRHAEGHGHLWQKQAIVLNEQQQSLKTDKQPRAASSTSSSSITKNSSTASSAAVEVAAAAPPPTTATTTTKINPSISSPSGAVEDLVEQPSTSASGQPVGITGISGFNAMPASLEKASLEVPTAGSSSSSSSNVETATPTATPITTTTTTTAAAPTICGKPNDWVVIPVFADIVKLALAERENCLQCLPNGHINVIAFDRMAAIVGAFTKHMQAMKSTQAPSSGEYEHFCTHMQRTTKLSEAGK